MSLRDELLIKPELKTESVFLPDLNKMVTVTAIRGSIRDEYELQLAQSDRKPYRAMWIAMCCIEDGKQVFEAGDILLIADTWTARDTNKAFNVISKLNGITEEEKEKIKNE